jgi:CRP-like cAMP-binding protein
MNGPPIHKNANRLLSGLSTHTLAGITQACTPVALHRGELLYETNVAPNYAYFITSGAASVVIKADDGIVREIDVIGNEGVIGGVHLLGPAPVLTRCLMRIEGTAMRIDYNRLKGLFQRNIEIRERILSFIQVKFLATDQLAACHRLHEAEKRLALWLLMLSDRTQSEVLPVTQGALADMLGVQRTTVTECAERLRRRDIIRYQRGIVVIPDRYRLESTTCSCYPVVKKLHDYI